MVDDKIDLLKHMEALQRQELNYRREMQYRIFTWSSTILLATIGAFLNPSLRPDFKAYGVWGQIVPSLAIGVLVVYSIWWQILNRRWHWENGAVIQRIDHLLHYYDKEYFDPKAEAAILPEHWESYSKKPISTFGLLITENYIRATALLGALAVAVFWIPVPPTQP